MSGTREQATSAYHPQSNSLVECQNRTIKTALVKALDENPNQTPCILEGALFAYCLSRHSSTKYSTFYLTYDREPVFLLT